MPANSITDIEDLAYKAFRRNADSELSRTLLATLLSSLDKTAGAPSFDPAVIPYARRIMLCAGSGSDFLKRMVYDLLREMWLKELDINENLLSDADNIRIQFIFSGLTAVLGSREVWENPQSMADMSQTDLGRISIKTLRQIAKNQQ